MAIELSPPSPADSTPPRAALASAQGKSPSGFSALLQGLGEPVAPLASAVSAVAVALSAAPSANLGSALGPLGPLGTGDARVLTAHSARSAKTPALGTSAGADSTPLLAPKTSTSLSDLSDLSDTPAGQPQAGAPDGTAQALVAQFLGMAGAHGAASLSRAVAAAPGQEEGRARLAAPVAPSVATPVAAAAPGASLSAPAPPTQGALNSDETSAEFGLGSVPGAGAGKRWLPSGSAQPKAAWQSTVSSLGTVPDARALSANASKLASEPVAQSLAGLTQAASAPTLVNALAESDQGLGVRRRDATNAEPNRLETATPTPAGFIPASGAPSSVGLASSGASASGQVLEQAVAEQVKYWISNDIHNAQLKFDGLGPQSVQVNISMSGNQAQVVFQSDQAQTRELLSNAMAQLDQMLRGEGLTLTAAWVGSSGQQGQFGSSAQQAQPAPQRAAATTTPALEAASAPARASISTNRAIDLFV